MVLWNKRVVEREKSKAGEFSVSCLFKYVEDGFPWVFIRLHGQVNNSIKGEMWEMLLVVAFRWVAFFFFLFD